MSWIIYLEFEDDSGVLNMIPVDARHAPGIPRVYESVEIHGIKGVVKSVHWKYSPQVINVRIKTTS